MRTPAGSVLLLMIAACGAAGPEGPPLYVIEVSGERFRVEVTEESAVSGFEQRLQSGQVGVVSGPLLPGDGGFNAPWSWRLDPQQVHTPDLAIELCDGRPSMVEDDLEYWLESVGQFCPWGAKVVERER